MPLVCSAAHLEPPVVLLNDLRRSFTLQLLSRSMAAPGCLQHHDRPLLLLVALLHLPPPEVRLHHDGCIALALVARPEDVAAPDGLDDGAAAVQAPHQGPHHVGSPCRLDPDGCRTLLLVLLLRQVPACCCLQANCCLDLLLEPAGSKGLHVGQYP